VNDGREYRRAPAADGDGEAARGVSFGAEDRKGTSITIDAAYVNGQLSEVARDTDLSKYVL
jgi:ATP-dependent protease HslVU (ClpYQ) ATPase subunit